MKNILIIAGHGGSPYDSGACGCEQKEAVLPRELANLVQIAFGQVSDVRPMVYDQNNDAHKILRNGDSLPLTGINYVGTALQRCRKRFKRRRKNYGYRGFGTYLRKRRYSRGFYLQEDFCFRLQKSRCKTALWVTRNEYSQTTWYQSRAD